ncbi:hypothetical protein ABHC40_12530 [Turicibacter sanguinis]|uniref:hypothetical protein n=1 Tax=Turicibacter sanguinis TaxID=154288 RepID=UPI00325B4668
MKAVKKYDRKELKNLATHVLEIGTNTNLDELLNDVSDWLVNLLIDEDLMQQKENKCRNRASVSYLS